jgi:hypothetical protein
VIRTECVEFMPFYLSLSTFLMSASFAMYGLLLRDFFIYVSARSILVSAYRFHELTTVYVFMDLTKF